MSSAVCDQFAYMIWRHVGISQCLIVDAKSNRHNENVDIRKQRKHSENYGNMRWLRIFTYSYQ